MPKWVVGKLADALNTQGKAIRGSKVLVLGVAYKKNVDDPRESPSIELMELLQEKGAVDFICDRRELRKTVANVLAMLTRQSADAVE